MNREERLISIHALREEGDVIKKEPVPGISEFLSTPSARRATPLIQHPTINTPFLSTPSARRATLDGDWDYGKLAISIHALREEGDMISASTALCGSDFYPRPPRGGRHHQHRTCLLLRRFLSTPSARRATKELEAQGKLTFISIHALREEGDAGHRSDACLWADFYPRPPRGGRRD